MLDDTDNRAWLHFLLAYAEREINTYKVFAFPDGGNRTRAAFAESQCAIHCVFFLRIIFIRIQMNGTVT